jgi:hypothetical protein
MVWVPARLISQVRGVIVRVTRRRVWGRPSLFRRPCDMAAGLGWLISLVQRLASVSRQ